MKKVSVLINNYNYAQYLNYCIDSILAQEYPAIEIIVYDDGSTDESLNILASYGNKITFISAPNFGKYPSYNQGNAIYQAFLKSTGDYIFLLDSDHAFLPQKITKVVSVFESAPKAVLVQSNMFEMDINSKPTGKIAKNLLPGVDILKVIYATKRLDVYFMQTSGLAFRRTYLQKVLPIIEDAYPLVWPDVRLSRTALFYGDVITTDEILGEYRIHNNNDSSKLKSREFQIEFQKQLYSFFNSLALNNNGKTINPTNFHISNMQILFFALVGKASFSRKLTYLRRFFEQFYLS